MKITSFLIEYSEVSCGGCVSLVAHWLDPIWLVCVCAFSTVTVVAMISLSTQSERVVTVRHICISPLYLDTIVISSLAPAELFCQNSELNGT